MPFAVYLLANRRHGTLYVGVTNNLSRRMREHKARPSEVAARAAIDRLVWYELHERAAEAIQRETSIGTWHRDRKIRLIEASNPDWSDLTARLAQ